MFPILLFFAAAAMAVKCHKSFNGSKYCDFSGGEPTHPSHHPHTAEVVLCCCAVVVSDPMVDKKSENMSKANASEVLCVLGLLRVRE